MTSFDAVAKGVPVVRSNYNSERIRIAFIPLDETFDVTSAAIERDRSFIPDIPRLWSSDSNLLEVVNDFLAGLRSVREVSDDEVKQVQASLVKLQGLLSFPFTALELSAETSEEIACWQQAEAFSVCPLGHSAQREIQGGCPSRG